MAIFTIDRDKCKRDGICVAECPAKIIEIQDEESFPSVIQGGLEFCINCGHCVSACPHGALSLATMPVERCLPFEKGLMPTAAQLDHLFRSRRSIRTYRDEPLDQQTLTGLISFARYAPSGHNLQPVHWLVIRQKSDVQRLGAMVADWMKSVIQAQPAVAQAMHLDRVIDAWERGVDRVLRDAPHLIVAHTDAALPVAQADCIIALTYLELAAYTSGLAACWAGYFTAAANAYGPLQTDLSLPKGHKTFGAMMIGRPKYHYHRIPSRNEQSIEWR